MLSSWVGLIDRTENKSHKLSDYIGLPVLLDLRESEVTSGVWAVGMSVASEHALCDACIYGRV